ncbi:hypothetical protein [Yinghuangia soli]|uniref:Uncharacterized protein n=1 Tax=Yinghuangia soli TaxID=2908204 RepID=A0AA41Q257_9ACTN|nr:hypothetical protein [Yinghuangia soli]MCF2529059.1 hypothetical protein [Yinghuangia soli]
MSEAGAGSFIFDIVVNIFIFLLPDSIATEASVAFLVLVGSFVVYVRIRNAIRRRRLRQALATGDYAQVRTGSNPFAGNAGPGQVPGPGPAPTHGANPFAGAGPSPLQENRSSAD